MWNFLCSSDAFRVLCLVSIVCLLLTSSCLLSDNVSLAFHPSVQSASRASQSKSCFTEPLHHQPRMRCRDISVRVLAHGSTAHADEADPCRASAGGSRGSAGVLSLVVEGGAEGVCKNNYTGGETLLHWAYNSRVKTTIYVSYQEVCVSLSLVV